MLGQFMWMAFSALMGAIMISIGIALEWRDWLPYLVILPMLIAVGGFVAGYRGFIRYWRARPEELLYQRLHRAEVVPQPAMIVSQDELLPEVFKSAYPLVRLGLDMDGQKTYVDVLVQPELNKRFKPGNWVSVLCDPANAQLCALNREQVTLQLKPAANSYGD